ncbi:hypothetical protein Leryth_000225 [Lithospermum erythrorhizon]|nr:hypothetical protein Leryth_000225 [Lithospermum erythrorhizon]
MGEHIDQENGVVKTPMMSKLRYNSPFVQVALIGLVCFCCPGMFNALSGMGGAGQVDNTASNNANTALYTTFAIFGILGGGIYNILGPQKTLFAGCSTYVLYAGSLLYYNHTHKQSFVIVAGGLLGIGAGLLWAAQGAIMTSYPPHDRKGTYISMFWSIFNLGGVIGGLIPFVLNYNRTTAVSVNDGTYIGFMVFMSLGTVLSIAILHPRKVIRDDGSACTNIKYSSMSVEGVEILKLFLNWKMLLMVPAAWASNFFYTYQFNNVNGALFNLRTRGLNNVFYWGAQMIGSVLVGHIMDFSFKSRKVRGLVGIGVVAVLGTGIWGGGLAKQLEYSREHKPDATPSSDFTFWHLILQGLLCCTLAMDYSMPCTKAWFIGLLELWLMIPRYSAGILHKKYSGFYKGVQSAGAAVAWQVDTQNAPFLNQLIANWSLTTVSYPLLVLLVILAVKDDSNSIEGIPKIDDPKSAIPASANGSIDSFSKSTA